MWHFRAPRRDPPPHPSPTRGEGVPSIAEAEMRHDEPDHATANAAGVSAPRQKRPFRLALRIERFGVVPVRFPIAGVIVFVLMGGLAAIGVMRIEADDSLSQLFRSDSPEFKQYEEVTKRFPSSECAVVVGFEGRSLMERASLERLRDLVTELQLIDGTRGVVSLFSAREPPEGGHLPEPLFPDPLPEGKAYDALVQKVLSNEIIRGKLISEDGELALIVLALDPAAATGNGLSNVVTEIRKTVAENIAGTGLKGELSGVPVMQLDIRNAMERDRVVYNALGFVAAGQSKYQAFRDAILIAGPACVLTHATAGLSFFSLLFANSELIRTFGEAGIIATVVALAAVLTLVPLLGVLLVHRETSFSAQIKGADSAVDVLRSFCGWIAHRMVSRPGLYTLIAVALITTLGLLYVNLQPRYRLADLVPDKEQAVQASGRLDAKLTGANPLDILIEFPPGAALYDQPTLSCMAEVHAILERQAGVGNVWSIETLRRWLAERAGKSDAATLKQYIDILPPYLVRRFLSAEEDAVVVSGRIPDKDASQLLPVVESLDKSLGAVRAKYPGYRVSVTGLSAIAASNSADMINKLNFGLTIEIVFVAACIGLAFRSWIVALAVIPPGIFPVLMSGDSLWALGDALQFASIVALTASFGLALSATIHFLNRLRLEERPGEDPGGAVERATLLVGPAFLLHP